MTTQNPKTTPAQNPTPFKNPEIVRLIDETDNASTRAIAILRVMGNLFAESKGIHNDALYWVTQSAIEEIEKISKAVDSYAKTQK